MSGQSEIGPVEQILRNVDLAGIQDERARECIRLLLNLIESLTADLRKAQAENLYLREQLNRRKGGGGKPDQPKDTAGAKSQSSEKERAETKQRTRRGKLERVRIDREEVLKLDRASLPSDAQFKGYEDVRGPQRDRWSSGGPAEEVGPPHFRLFAWCAPKTCGSS